jgi:hypothetical protein
MQGHGNRSARAFPSVHRGFSCRQMLDQETMPWAARPALRRN